MNTLAELKTAKASYGVFFCRWLPVGFWMLVFRRGLEGLSLVAGRYVEARAVFGELLTQLCLITLLFSLIAGRWVGPRTEWRLNPRSVSEDRCSFVDGCCRYCLFLIFSSFFASGKLRFINVTFPRWLHFFIVFIITLPLKSAIEVTQFDKRPCIIIFDKSYASLWKHAYSNIQKIWPPKKKTFR